MISLGTVRGAAGAATMVLLSLMPTPGCGGGNDNGGGGRGGDAGAVYVGPMCDGIEGTGICTTCANRLCCDPIATCSADALCPECYRLAQLGDVLGQQEAGCFENAAYGALVDCINDRNGCGPVCNPSEGCGAVSCTTTDACTRVGCTSCGGGGRCL